MITEEVLKDIFKPNNLKWRTAITKVEPNRLLTRGHLQEDLIGNTSFAEMIYLLINGEEPSKNESKMLEAILVSFCDHGVTPPSTQSARLMASAGSPMHACLAGALLAFGENHAGAIEKSMQVLQEGINKTRSDMDIDSMAEIMFDYFMKREEKIPGFGHRYHDEDPRAPRLMELAQEYECLGRHSELALALENLLFESKGIRMNIDGANAGILSDLGFDWRLGSGMFMIGRLPGIMAHVHEEVTRESPFRKVFEMDEIYYDGKE
ncbi:MAG: citryl-CoA lyase [Methanobacteriaceae archaeon]|jgi:citrate synthase|nr:citryl-CoA lyase [Methanobacteriaceae archaeon]MDP2835918.1 citryl-CoA lyase [Methanobacteriaceae archaeon]MDP3035311.1 citryl-CoA lyase [Methanobacteriaceae archaeon]MDP3485719.1 citryl-CoA lyase [Methanobacteriaceae archaeon]MDP3623768.1 citryl-CoA lyase [Methanobacteriaceae archaeon]